MAALAFAAAGALLAPTGYAALGWTFGSFIGNTLFPSGGKDIVQEGPRINEGKISTSSYGEMVPIIEGTARSAGKVIWQTPREEHRHEDTQDAGGKGGGGGGSVTQVSYTYTINQAYLLCEGEIAGVRRIWANGKLVWDVSAGGSISSALGSAALAQDIRVYPGSFTQDIDPLIQADKGELAQAYVGSAYIVFENLKLDAWGGAVPNFEFEIVKEGSSSAEITAIAPANAYLSPVGSITPDGLLLTAWDAPPAIGGAYKLATLSPSNGAIVQNYDISSVGLVIGQKPMMTASRRILVVVDSRLCYFAPGGSLPQPVYQEDSYDTESGTGFQVEVYSNIVVEQGSDVAWFGARPRDGFAGLSNALARYNAGDNEVSAVVYLYSVNSGVAENITAVADDYGNYIYCGGLTSLYRVDKSTGVVVNSVATSGGVQSIAVASDGSVWTIAKTGKDVRRWASDLSSSTIIGTISHSGVSEAYEVARDWTTGGIFIVGLGGAARLYSPSGSLNTEYTTALATGQSLATHPSYPGHLFLFNRANSGGDTSRIHFLLRYSLTASSTTLDQVVQSLCLRAGYDVLELDVTALASITLDGYRALQVGSLRSILEPLQKAYFFDAVESDYKIKFVKRGGASLITIPEEDLACIEAGEEPGETLQLIDGQETELPYQVTVRALDPARDYQPNSQYDRRITKTSLNVEVMELPVVLSAAQMKAAASAHLYSRWRNARKAKFFTSLKYAKYEPTDIITVPRNGVNYDIRIEGKNQLGNRIEWDGCVEDSETYVQEETGVSAPTPETEVEFAGTTLLYLLDIPLLRDLDDDFGLYGAARGTTSAWSSAALYKSIDSGASFTTTGTVFTSEVTAGTASGALGDFLGGNVFDELNTVTIVLQEGSLSSVTEEALLNGANAAYLAGEIIQFRDATLVDTDTYVLSGLLRGRKGTEQYMSTHAAGDQFFLLNTTTLRRVAMDSSELNLARVYKAPASGQSLFTAPATTFTNTCAGKKPLSPAHAGGGRNSLGDLAVQWLRRTRVGGQWLDGVDVTLGEASEEYEIDVLNSLGTTVLYTKTGLTSPNWTYPATGADSQTTHFGSPQASIKLRIYQISESVGRGFPLSITI